jgi:hypothetical protein
MNKHAHAYGNHGVIHTNPQCCATGHAVHPPHAIADVPLALSQGYKPCKRCGQVTWPKKIKKT